MGFLIYLGLQNKSPEHQVTGRQKFYWCRVTGDLKKELPLPQRRTSIKSLIQDQKRHLHNLDLRTDLRKTIKKFLTTVSAKNASEAQNLLKTVFKKLDKAAKRNIIHKNTASRRKSRFSKLVLACLNNKSK